MMTLTKKNPQFTETALCFSLSPENLSGALPGAGSGRESAAPRGLRGSANSCAESIGGPLCGCPHNKIPTVWDPYSGPWFIGILPFAGSRGFRDLKWQELHTSSSETSVLYLNKGVFSRSLHQASSAAAPNSYDRNSMKHSNMPRMFLVQDMEVGLHHCSPKEFGRNPDQNLPVINCSHCSTIPICKLRRIIGCGHRRPAEEFGKSTL